MNWGSFQLRYHKAVKLDRLQRRKNWRYSKLKHKAESCFRLEFSVQTKGKMELSVCEYLEVDTCNARRVFLRRDDNELSGQPHGVAPHRSVLCRWAALCSLAVRALGWRQQLGRQCEGGDPRCLAVKLAEVAGGRATSPGGRGLSPASDICKMPLVIYLYSPWFGLRLF